MTVLFFKRFIFKLFEHNTCNSVAIYVSDLKCCMFICMGKVVPACQISAGSNAKHANNKALNCVHGYDPPAIFFAQRVSLLYVSCLAANAGYRFTTFTKVGYRFTKVVRLSSESHLYVIFDCMY